MNSAKETESKIRENGKQKKRFVQEKTVYSNGGRLSIMRRRARFASW